MIHDSLCLACFLSPPPWPPSQRLGCLKHLLPVSLVLNVLTPVTNLFCGLLEKNRVTLCKGKPFCGFLIQLYTDTYLCLDLLLHLFEVGPQIHGHLVLGAQQSLEHGVSGQTDLLQSWFLHWLQFHHFELQILNLWTEKWVNFKAWPQEHSWFYIYIYIYIDTCVWTVPLSEIGRAHV